MCDFRISDLCAAKLKSHKHNSSYEFNISKLIVFTIFIILVLKQDLKVCTLIVLRGGKLIENISHIY